MCDDSVFLQETQTEHWQMLNLTVNCSKQTNKSLVIQKKIFYWAQYIAFFKILTLIQLPACDLGKQSRTAPRTETLHPRGRAGGSTWLLASDQLSSSCCGYLGSEARWNISLSVFLSFCKSVFPTKINKSLKFLFCVLY